MNLHHTSHSPPRTQHQAGLTLIELMVTVTIALTLGLIAIPSFTSQIAQSRQSNAISALSGGLSLARSSAIKASRPVAICISTDQASCTAAADTQSNWALGWLIYLDADGDGAFDSTKDTLLSAQAGLSGLTDATSTQSNNQVIFLPNGSTSLGAEDTITFKSDKDGLGDKKLSINVLGRVYRSDS